MEPKYFAEEVIGHLNDKVIGFQGLVHVSFPNSGFRDGFVVQTSGSSTNAIP